MKNKQLTSITSMFLSIILWGSSYAAEKTIISYPSRNYAFLPAQVAVVKGFFKDEGLEPVLVQMRPPVTVPALMSGEIQCTMAFASIMTAAMQGMPLKVLAILTEKPLHHLVSRPEIKTIAELRGKKVGTQLVGGGDHLISETILKAKGLDPVRDVQYISLGADEPVRADILRKGLVDAITVTPPGLILLQRDGYNILGGPKDLKIGSPASAFATTEARIKHENTKKALRAIVRGLRFTRDQRAEVIPIMMRWFQQTQEIASQSYDLIFPSFSPDGGASEATYQWAIDIRKSALKTDKPIPLSQVRDLSVLKEVQRELGL